MRRVAPIAVLAWCVVSTAALVAALWGMRLDPLASAEAGRENLRALWPMWLAAASGWAALTGVWIILARRPGDGLDDAVGGRRAGIRIILLVAIAARAAVLAGHDPALSDDVYRYVFDGRNLAAGVNPYLAQPAGRRGTETPRWPGEAAVAARVNNPELHTIYLPTSQWAFGAIALLMPDGVADPDAVARWLRAGLTLVEMLVIVLLLRAAAARGRSPWWVALYAWHPLAICEVAGSGHQEPLGLLLLVTALSLAPRRVTAWTTALAAGALVKPVVIPIAGLLLRERRWTTWLRSGLIGLTACAIIAGPLLLAADGAPIDHLRATATRFSLKWAHFGGVYEPLLWVIERLMPGPNDPQERLARALCTVALAATIVFVLLRRADPWAGASAMLLAMVVLSPAVHPWYALWPLVLVPMAPSPAVWAASLTLPWGYAAWGFGDGTWGAPAWLVAVAWMPILLAGMVSGARAGGRGSRASSEHATDDDGPPRR